VTATSGGLARSASASFTLTLPKLALVLNKTKLAAGDNQRMTVLSKPNTTIKTSIRFPNGALWNRTGETDEHGALSYHFKVPAHYTTGNNHKVMVYAFRGKTSVHKSFSING
jgi:hypothetical protein